MEITTDLEYIKEMALVRDVENWEFRSFLKRLDMASEEIDAIVHKIVDDVMVQIDCTKCANCCKKIGPILDKDDISKFACGLKIPTNEFMAQYLLQDEEQDSKYKFNELPCPFLKNDQCANYEFRPEECRSYPHLHKKDFVSRLMGVIANYEFCPIVFNVYEQLKTELW